MTAGKILSESENNLISKPASEVNTQFYTARISNKSQRGVINALQQFSVKKVKPIAKNVKTMTIAIIWTASTRNCTTRQFLPL